MANYNTTAKVTLSVNGRQAQQVLSTLQAEAQSLERKIAKAATAGDKATMRKLQRELTSTNRLISQLQGSANTAEQVLRRLDKATPKELQRTLRTLNAQLNSIERGSAAWNEHINKIRRVKEELASVNRQLSVQQSRWEKLNNWLNNTQTALMGIAAAFAGLVMAGRKAVNTYAEMEEQLAGTRKYTGLSEESVLKLNEAFQNMDTRTSRQQLNELAQEAGRLGKNTLESVQGYVEAADIIHVALDDLGEGATQTIAKLTNIFGVDKMLGTKEAMLAVGSTVNELSQNCTASSSYLVEFAQRMAGIGASAGLTIPQILAFGAVLDANGQKVEMSATAIQKVINNLANKNQEFASRLGLDAQKLNETLKHSARDGIMMFLQALHDIGEKGGYENATMVLAPAFKDMGMDAARVSQVLATLANHIDEVKWQLGEADKAFEEASSATHEYEIFNNTAQASIDKAKKRVTELAVQLGEKLYPIMKHIYSSSGLFLRALNQIVSFIIEYRRVIVPLVASLATYYATLTAVKVATGAWQILMSSGRAIIAAYQYAVGLCEVAIIALTKGTKAAGTAMTFLNQGMKASPWGVVLAAVTAVGVGIYNLCTRTDELTKVTKSAMRAAKGYNEEAVKEQHELDVLFGKLKGTERGTKDYEDAKKSIINQYGKYLSGLINEKGEIVNLEDAYNRLTTAVRRSAQARGIAAAREQIDEQYFKGLSQNLTELQETLEKSGASTREAAEIVAGVGQAMSSGKAIPQKYVDKINAYSSRIEWRLLPDWIGGDQSPFFGGKSRRPSAIVNRMYKDRGKRQKSNEALEAMEDGNSPFRRIDATWLKRAIEGLEKIVKSGRGGNALVFLEGSQQGEYKELSVAEAKKILHNYKEELALRGEGQKHNKKNTRNGKDEGGVGGHTATTPTKITDSGSGNGGTQNRFAVEEEAKERAEAEARIAYATGKKNYLDYLDAMNEASKNYYDSLLKRTDLSEMERLKIQAQYEESRKKIADQGIARSAEKEEARYNKEMVSLRQSYIDGQISKKTFDASVEEQEIIHQRNLTKVYAEGSKERLQAERQLQQLLMAQTGRRQQETEAAEKKLAEARKKYFGQSPAEKQWQYFKEYNLLMQAYDREMTLAKNNAEEKLRIEKAFQIAKLALQKEYGIISNNEEKSKAEQLTQDLIDWFDSDTTKKFLKSYSVLTSGMGAIFSSLTSLVQAELELQTASIEKRYEKEISAAEGNSYRVKKLEKEKEREIARAKEDANRKMFAMQVIQAIAQTAQNAISAYGDGLQIGGLAGLILAPIAASMAVAAGMIQIAAIKKQQQASAAQGYSAGGFTPDGKVDEPVGIVHAGEWVASQKLVKSPRTRPLIEALDYAQRNNTIGSLKASDVSRSITAPMVLAQQSASPQIVVAKSQPTVVVEQNREYTDTMRRLADRLAEPFVTVATVTGDKGINKAQEEYDRLIRNKKPKSRK